MVLDVKALTWAGKHDIDTAKLKKARVPIYGKWYFPEIPPNVALVNLETGEQQVFPERMVAGEVVYVPSAELQRASLAPPDFAVMEVAAPAATSSRALASIAPEPLLAMARPPGLPHPTAAVSIDGDRGLIAEDPAVLAAIHMPRPSISPFVLAIGFCIAFLGVITNPVILVVGLLWILVGAIIWVRIGLLESRAAATHGHAEADHG